MIKDIKFLATDVAPNPKEITHWVDLNEDSTGGVIKTFDGKEWKSITSSNSDSDKYVNMTIELVSSYEAIIDGKVYNIKTGIIYDNDLLNYLKNIYNSNKSLMIDFANVSNSNAGFYTKINTHVIYVKFKNGDIYYDVYGISLTSVLENSFLQVADTDFPDFEPE